MRGACVFDGQGLAGAGFSIAALVTENDLWSETASPPAQPDLPLLHAQRECSRQGRNTCACGTGGCPSHPSEEDMCLG